MGDIPTSDANASGVVAAADFAALQADVAELLQAFASLNGATAPEPPAAAAATATPSPNPPLAPREDQVAGRAPATKDTRSGDRRGDDDADSLLYARSSESDGGPTFRRKGRRVNPNDGHPDGLDDPDIPNIDDVLISFKMPRRIHRADALPIPFTPTDFEHIEPGLAELYLANDAVPRNKGCSPGWNRFLNAVAVDEARVITKRAAEERVNNPRRRRGPTRLGAQGGSGGGQGGGGGGGSGGGRGGAAGGYRKDGDGTGRGAGDAKSGSARARAGGSGVGAGGSGCKSGREKKQAAASYPGSNAK
ncbi:hypothetical protein BU14_0224s0002 [Porphyra umbilicalis]|uniref:Uncharacterized protein n=1 Tax=Porphyra umbilicalis TaxID=2786 RepID=A0A1X6P4E5_PORUM|nr:hypothetical protein BU14_0224s0002 [Porphyra umbilicalis]|eukprot:OSX75704.1 hypothetical protein BU14_0224s0002 [Porphyra umbilicalis]